MNKVRKGLVALIAGIALGAGAVVAIPGASAPASALSGSEFNPGMIISDQLFYDGAAMTAAQIQTFLDGKIGTCQNSNCLNTVTVPVTSRSATYASNGGLECSAISGGNLRIADLIYRTQVACGISAKVILVTLQKEQGLVTNPAPSDAALRAAMGMGCPDTAPCNDAYAGLANQIMLGTQQLKIYKVARFARQPGVQYVQYNPNTECGGATINVTNYATAALYSYTPYQPNAAALANLGATGDGCSSYGNRNFWSYYRTWFGSVDGAQFMVSTADSDYLIARDSNNELWAYPVKAGGGWGLRTSLGLGWGGLTDIIGVGDLDSNGYRDIIARDSTGKSWFYSGSAALAYPTRKLLSVDWSQAKQILYGGLVDAGLDGDMLTIDASGVLWLWPGNGAGDFGAAVKVGSGYGADTLVTGVGDFTGDNCGDLISITTSGALMLSAGDCAGGFRAPTQIGTGFGAFTNVYAAGDFTGDGIPDLWAEDAGGVMHLFRGTGGGGIATTSTTDSGWNALRNISGAGMRPPHPATVTTVSSTADMFAGYLIARDSSNTLWAYPANGAGTWRDPRVSLGAGWGGVTDIIGVGDLDGNGYRDIIARDTAGKSWFYPGNGQLAYPVRHQITSDWSTAKQILYGGYFDGDAFADMLTTDASGTLWLWPGNGAGDFGAKVKVASGFGDAIAITGVGDVTGDGCGDIATISAAKQLLLYPGNCAGGLAAPITIAANVSGFTSIYAMGDFTGDRIPDLWLKAADGSIQLFRGTGAGAVLATSTTDAGWGSFLNITGSGMTPGVAPPAGSTRTTTPAPTPTPTAGQPGVGDVNGDGKRDFLGVSSSGALRAYYGDGAGHIGSDSTLSTSWNYPGALQFPMGDFTGDGHPDIGVITPSGSFLIAKGTSGGFANPVPLATAWGGFQTVVGGFDWDGDGHDDVMALSASGQLWLYRGNGAGGWASQNGVLLGSGWQGYRPIPVGDFDGTGGQDILALQSNGDLWLYRGNGKGGWASLNGTRIGTGWNTYVSVFSPGDFDGVPGTDVLARSADGKLYLFSGTGTGQLGPKVQIDSGWQTFRAIL